MKGSILLRWQFSINRSIDAMQSQSKSYEYWILAYNAHTELFRGKWIDVCNLLFNTTIRWVNGWTEGLTDGPIRGKAKTVK